MNELNSFLSHNSNYQTGEVIQKILWEKTIAKFHKILPAIPETLLTYESHPNSHAIESIFLEGKWLNLMVHPQSWPKKLLEIYFEDLLVLFPSLRSKTFSESNLQPVSLCQYVKGCKNKRMVLENRDCPFNCLGICALGTFQNKSFEGEFLNNVSIGYYLGLTKRQVIDRLKKANTYLRKEIKKTRAFYELISNKG
ncbi:hypothetical protein [Methylacidiphilum caldifontis]|uniref:Uncharacterized protein n=1 Tax=Methylacidiphilum caldifontis TaxID=2795386 RepID=A0A4Y8P7I4_9BACT|nr:hypothetical protein [Methylacidiphilum caldifontis]QSR88903.1 hypothetical protein IT6_00925 [Methylacidiphilum caldifontis]TFE66189.1 hypothetical protein A7Q10_02320 [Methylacidiphilum caldifontis]